MIKIAKNAANINNNKKLELVLLILGVFLGLFNSPLSFAEEYVNKTYGVRLRYPPVFEPVTLNNPSLLLALKSVRKSYPTFNVIVLPLDFPISQSEQLRATENIINDYKAVGLMDAKSLTSTLRTINGTDCLEVELNYSQSNEPMSAYVSIFYAQDQRFVLTFIDKIDNYQESKPLAKQITNSFTLLNPRIAAKERQNDKSFPYHLIVIFSLLLLPILVICIKRSRPEA